MITEPTVAQLLKKVDNRYELIIATAKRARQISAGSSSIIKKDEVESSVTVAAEEINQGLVSITEGDGTEENEDIE